MSFQEPGERQATTGPQQGVLRLDVEETRHNACPRVDLLGPEIDPTPSSAHARSIASRGERMVRAVTVSLCLRQLSPFIVLVPFSPEGGARHPRSDRWGAPVV